MTAEKSGTPLAPDLSSHGVVVYLRVSTGRQAETDLSIPDQRRQLKVWCDQNHYAIAAEFVEAGASATDDKRPEFQRMIDFACGGENGVSAIIVHSYSRFFRDAFGLEFYLRKLGKHGVKLISITQEFHDETNPAQGMMRKVVALFDEYQSKENGKHVLRAMKENARQGFWNGARPPFGYKAVEVDRRGARVKKRLEIDLVEAETVRLIFRLFLDGDQGSGPMGVKSVTVWLNTRGYRTRSGAKWGIGPVHVLLTNQIYAGRQRFNVVDSKTRGRKPASEHILTAAPVIIERENFDAVQVQLRQRNPRITPPRLVSGPILLTGLAFCATCSGAMTLRTGTSKTGKVHKYYSCSTCARQGKAACKGRSIAMDRLDKLVIGQLIDRLLDPDRLGVLIEAIAARRKAQSIDVDARMAALHANAAEADERLRRLYKLVEDGNAVVDDILHVRITALKAERDIARATLQRAAGVIRPPTIDPAKITAFGKLMRERLTTGEIPFRKAYLSAIIDRIEADDGQIRIHGRKDVLEQAVIGNSGTPPGVRSFVRRWRPQETFADLSSSI